MLGKAAKSLSEFEEKVSKIFTIHENELQISYKKVFSQIIF